MQYSYHGNGNVSEQVTVGGKIYSYEYNYADELVKLNIDNEIERIFEHNANGHTVKITNNALETDYTTDDLGNVLEESIPHVTGKILSRSFNSNNHLTNIQLGAEHQVEISYNDNGLLESVSDGNSTLDYAYVDNSQKILTRKWRVNNNVILELENDYDEFIDLNTVKVNDLPEASYSRNKDKQIVGAILNDGTDWSYEYDELRQLINARSEFNAMSYTYDMIGNRLESTENETVKNYSANLLNQYTVIGDEEPVYDIEGNVQTNNGWAYTWNAEKRLLDAEKDNIKLEFSYDHMGRRIEKKVYQANVLIKHHKFVYDGYKLFAIYDGLNNDALFMTFIWQPIGLDVPLCMKYNGSTYYFVTDGGKNITGIFDETANRVATYSYAPFGKIINATGALATVNPFRFSSEYHDDETDLIYYNFRYYCPGIGRWTRRDPLEEESDLNLYLYTSNNPVDRFDNLGQWSTNVHQDTTTIIARKLGYLEKISRRLGEIDEAVDGGKTGILSPGQSFLPGWGNQQYHFDRPWGGSDSRMEKFAKHFEEAKYICRKRSFWNWITPSELEKALYNLGTSLHPLQDWSAHGDYGKLSSFVGVFLPHNMRSPQTTFGSPLHYPDRIDLDVEGSPDGRAAGNYFKIGYSKLMPVSIPVSGSSAILTGGTVTTLVETPVPPYEYAIYKKGTKRYQLVSRMTKVELNGFKKFLNSSQADPRCRCYFLGK